MKSSIVADQAGRTGEERGRVMIVQGTLDHELVVQIRQDIKPVNERIVSDAI